MRSVRAVVVPILLLAALGALAWLNIDIAVIAQFPFIWDVLLGVALGVGLALLLPLSGFAVRRNALTGMLWVCAFLSLLIIFYQYMVQVTGLHVEALTFLAMPGTRLCIVEGAVLGFTTLIAARGKA